jgi:hypothetical protein
MWTYERNALIVPDGPVRSGRNSEHESDKWASLALFIAVHNHCRGIEMKKRWKRTRDLISHFRLGRYVRFPWVLRYAKSHVRKDRYIKAFDPAVMAAMKKLEATVDLVNQSAPRVHQIQ